MPGDWFIVHTYSGYENKVKANLERRIDSMEMQDRIFRIEVPVEEVEELKSGKKKVVKRKLYPGYVLVEMQMSDASWYVVRNTPGVTGFIGSDNKPVSLTPEEVHAILGRQSLSAADRLLLMGLAVGDTVRVLEGAFADQVGRIEEIFPEQEKIRILIDMFARPTPIEVGIAEVERV
ncbi:MAG: transcription termination/antitermination protein NusG [Symbiobacteriaceae bacterium]|nr:transcription termination/antitermination protein NusG [Symbiobacteriaceae bacterium]